ncbi:phage replisome organizer, putative, N-terminal region [Lentibacillus persicus]|uniref:Phage replisome organizer, putative, N-terminal region n=1 Tax=Lentibacillus persicus TaxID=640948 RepID=A0A1I2B3U7_9BACI|nr:phage replisome organizer N-terminal domain-containing protein [Lentibacillus persicus]SFE50719.1 phage replisome organizer, putative, N-terminal region [Lentibacillus persicus]
MRELKWIKLDISMFEDEKIKLIEQMPEADTILIIWVKLLAQAGKTNANGYIYLNENIPYTEEMLATIFGRPVNTVRLALKTLRDFGMIDIDEDSFIYINNWEKHQNIEGMERAKKLNAERNKRYRERKKQQKLLNKTSRDVSVTSHDGTEEEQEQERRKKKEDKEQEQPQTSAIIQFWDSNGFGLNNIQGKNQLLSWLDDSSFTQPEKIIVKAMEIACANNKRQLNYVEGILRNWENQSLLTLEEIENNKKEKKKQSAANDGYHYGF